MPRDGDIADVERAFGKRGFLSLSMLRELDGADRKCMEMQCIS